MNIFLVEAKSQSVIRFFKCFKCLLLLKSWLLTNFYSELHYYQLYEIFYLNALTLPLQENQSGCTTQLYTQLGTAVKAIQTVVNSCNEV